VLFYTFFFQAEDGIRDFHVTGVQTCALPIFNHRRHQLLDWEMLRAQYAAEAGIAVVQARLREDPEWTGAMSMTWDGIRVRTVVEGRTSDGIRLRSVGRTSGVKQTIRVALDPETLAVKRWER